jgi:predicted esterase YcpF (UPF0227 family)
MSGRLLYLHGFLSAPASRKAQETHARMQALGLGDAFVCPQLPVSPKAAIALCESLLVPGTTVVGSSLGGFYATWLCENHPDRVRAAVLINPAVVAHISLARYIGTQKNLYTGEAFEFTQMHIDEMQALNVAELKRSNAYWLLAEEGDEVLDYRQAVNKYAGAQQTVLPGGNHTFSRWHEYMDAVIAYSLPATKDVLKSTP